jgi:ribonuclease VapC
MMFLDASAIVAILTREPGADALIAALETAHEPITSPVALFEAALGICRKRRSSIEEAQEDVRQLVHMTGIRTMPITEKETGIALAAFARYGKGRGHPARLNLGDCFAYAMAKSYQATLLFKGDDFDKTDIRSATATR